MSFDSSVAKQHLMRPIWNETLNLYLQQFSFNEPYKRALTRMPVNRRLIEWFQLHSATFHVSAAAKPGIS